MEGYEFKVDVKDQKNGTYLAEYSVDKLCGKSWIIIVSVLVGCSHQRQPPFSTS